MLDEPQKRRSVAGPLFLAVLVGAGLVGAYRLGVKRGLARVPAPAAPAAESAVLPGPSVDAGFEATAEDAGVAAAPAVAGTPHQAGVQVITVDLRGSLDESLQAQGGGVDGAALALVASRLLVWWLHPGRDVRPGDRLSMLYEIREGEEPLVIALRYRSLKLGATKIAVRFQPGGSAFAHYYDEAGREIEERLTASPLEDYEQVTSLLRDGRGHKGVDFKVPVGTPVRATFDGVVLRRNWKVRANGDCLALEDPKTKRQVFLLHLSSVDAAAKPGASVKQGQIVGRSGNTGHTTAPHLHYQLMAADGRVLDPFAVSQTERRSLAAAPLEEFQREARGLLGRLPAEAPVDPQRR